MSDLTGYIFKCEDRSKYKGSAITPDVPIHTLEGEVACPFCLFESKLAEKEKQLELSQKREAILKPILLKIGERFINNGMFFDSTNGFSLYWEIAQALKEVEEIK
jgi:hypothetical protein